MRKKLFAISLAIGVLLCASGCGGGSKTPDPNRKEEACSYKGTAPVYGAEHQATMSCSPDGDGWVYPVIGHHHHK